ncbi:MAG: helix-turn-helix transcriptional regulator [Eubacteriales bacterium]
MSLGSNVEYRRKRARMTQEELGEKAGVSGATISNIERGLKAPSVSTLFKIAKVLETTMDNLANEQEVT